MTLSSPIRRSLALAAFAGLIGAAAFAGAVIDNFSRTSTPSAWSAFGVGGARLDRTEGRLFFSVDAPADPTLPPVDAFGGYRCQSARLDFAKTFNAAFRYSLGPTVEGGSERFGAALFFAWPTDDDGVPGDDSDDLNGITFGTVRSADGCALVVTTWLDGVELGSESYPGIPPAGLLKVMYKANRNQVRVMVNGVTLATYSNFRGAMRDALALPPGTGRFADFGLIGAAAAPATPAAIDRAFWIDNLQFNGAGVKRGR